MRVGLWWELMHDPPEERRGVPGAMPPVDDEREENIREQGAGDGGQAATGEVQRRACAPPRPRVRDPEIDEHLHGIDGQRADVPADVGSNRMRGKPVLQGDQRGTHREHERQRELDRASRLRIEDLSLPRTGGLRRHDRRQRQHREPRDDQMHHQRRSPGPSASPRWSRVVGPAPDACPCAYRHRRPSSLDQAVRSSPVGAPATGPRVSVRWHHGVGTERAMGCRSMRQAMMRSCVGQAGQALAPPYAGRMSNLHPMYSVGVAAPTDPNAYDRSTALTAAAASDQSGP